MTVKKSEGLSADDYQMIKQLAGCWSQALFEGNSEAFSDCFIDDGCLELTQSWLGLSAGSYQGHKELSSLPSQIQAAITTPIQFWFNIPIIEGDSRSATFTAYALAFTLGTEGPLWIGSCTHRDKLVKVGSQWRFSQRTLDIEKPEHGDWPQTAMEALAVGGSLAPTPYLDTAPVTDSGTVLDHELILQVHARYTYHWDHNEPESWANLYTPDGVFQLAGVDHMYEAAAWHAEALPTSYSGRKELADFGEAASVGKSELRERHWNNLPVIRIYGDRATAHVQCMTRTAGELTENMALTTVYYYDDLQKVDGQWFFKKRWGICEFPTSQEEIQTHLGQS